jgi:hypothetical protein
LNEKLTKLLQKVSVSGRPSDVHTSLSLSLTGAESIFLTHSHKRRGKKAWRQVWFDTYDNEDSLVSAADGTRR